MACETQKQLKDETSNCTNPGRIEMFFDRETKSKFNNNTTILDEILSNQWSSEDNIGLSYGGTEDKAYASKYISDPKQPSAL